MLDATYEELLSKVDEIRGQYLQYCTNCLELNAMKEEVNKESAALDRELAKKATELENSKEAKKLKEAALNKEATSLSVINAEEFKRVDDRLKDSKKCLEEVEREMEEKQLDLAKVDTMVNTYERLVKFKDDVEEDTLLFQAVVGIKSDLMASVGLRRLRKGVFKYGA
jgi:chromosome segregation ATPase